MPSCSHCSGNRPIPTDEQLIINSPDGTRKKRRRLFTSCSACGRVLRDRSLRSLDKALAAIQDIATNALHLNPNATTTTTSAADDESTSDSIIISDAQDLVRKAMAKEELFGLGRHTRTHVAAACLYISLRRRRKPYMLIDLSDYLKVTVYVLGAMFVALCRILRIKEDLKEEEEEVENRYSISSSSSSSSCCCFVIDPSLFMHRISTRLLGRKDAEVASMALRILSRTNQKQRGWMLTKQKQIPVRRICTAALYITAATAYEDDGRVRKFSKLDVARAVRSEFKSMESGDGLTMDEFVSRAAGTTTSNGGGGGGGELVCQHKKSSKPHCRYGLCKECYHVFVTIAGEVLEHSAEPPPPSRRTARMNMNKIGCEGELVKALESLSDVEDYDISEYLNTETEKRHKTMIWELMNKEYLEEKKSNDAAAKVAAAGNKPNKERKKQRRVGGNTLSEEMLPEKRVSSRINYDVLAQLNGEAERQLETDVGGVGSEEKNEGHFDIVEAAMEEDHSEAEAEIDGDGKSAAAAEGDDCCGDFEEDYGDGGYNEYCDDDFADDDDDDFGF